MERQTFRTIRTGSAIAAGLLAVAGVAPVVLLIRHVTLGPAPVLAPVILLPIAAYAFWFGVVRHISIDVDRTGLAVSRGPRRWSVPWGDVREVGVLPASAHGTPSDLLVAWPRTAPAAQGARDHLPIVFDPDLGGYILGQMHRLAATPAQLEAAVGRLAPGKWGVPTGQESAS